MSRTLSDWKDRLRFGPKGRDSKAQGNALGMRARRMQSPNGAGLESRPVGALGPLGFVNPRAVAMGFRVTALWATAIKSLQTVINE